MPLFDLTGADLRGHRTESPEPPDFDDYWQQSLAETRSHPLAAHFEPVATPLALVDVLDVTFAGWAGQPIRAWLTLPRGIEGALPAVVEYIGYGGGRGLAHEASLYALAGWAHLRMDTRGQGSTWTPGDTPDPDPTGSPHHPGMLTRGVQDPATYYYRRVFADAVRAVEAVRAHPRVDARRVAVTGNSQGGGITIAAAALAGDVVAAAPDVPFLCDIRRATTLVDTQPYVEVATYLRVHRDQVETVLGTLDYVDGAHHAARATAPSLWSVALMDETCPPSTVYAAYNAWSGPKEIVEYPFNSHEGGQAFHDARRLAFLHEAFARV